MTDSNFLNVYTGPDSVRKYFDPDSTPPLPLVELPACLNPYRQDGVRIYAKMMTMHPANNVKAMPALNLLEGSVVPGKTDTIVEYSSGSTVISMSLVSRVYYGVTDVRAFLSNKTSDAKLKLMQFFGLGITLFGGPSQPEPLDDRGGIRVAQRLGRDAENIVNPNQYENDDNWKSHIRWTGPQILRQLPHINVICAGMGTSGTITGLGTYFHTAKPSVFRLGVCTAAGDRVPGPRSYALLAPVEFPWKQAVDQVEEVGSHDSFALSLELCRNGIVAGPSSGFNLRGLFQFLARRKAAGTLADLAAADQDGDVHCVFLCCDLPYQYIDEYFAKLGPGHFPAMQNEALKTVDLYRYDAAWERDASSALPAYFENGHTLLHPASSSGSTSNVLLPPGGAVAVRPKAGVTVLDLREAADFARSRLPGAANLPTARAADPSPCADAGVLAAAWTRLEARFAAPDARLRGSSRVLVLCYDGDCARVAASVLRAKGYVAESVRGGYRALRQPLPTTQDAGVVEEAGTPTREKCNQDE
ncbi:tryptophan synthase beta subunit-like PLP-dependent enzyme [Xylariomycetidae sp. FL0641]|nr:tryptophan synthase beta subunit-like PLP-dependent enzyme [Xylariomycetidae sp. FL0641]